MAIYCLDWSNLFPKILGKTKQWLNKPDYFVIAGSDYVNGILDTQNMSHPEFFQPTILIVGSWQVGHLLTVLTVLTVL